MWWVTTQKNGASALGLQHILGLSRYETAWTMLHRLRGAMVRPGRDLLTGRVEVDECYLGGPEEDLPGRLNSDKTLVVVASQEDGPGIGRIRMRQISDASAASLTPFVQDSVAPESVVHTDGWLGYSPLKSKGFVHEITFLKGRREAASELLPRVRLVISLLKRWLMGTLRERSAINTWTTIWTSSRSASISGDPGAGANPSFAWRSRLSLSIRHALPNRSPKQRRAPEAKLNPLGMVSQPDTHLTENRSDKPSHL